MPWVQRGLENPSGWVETTAPERRDSVAISAQEADVAITGKEKGHRFRGALKKMKGILQKSHRDSPNLISDQSDALPGPSGPRGTHHMTPSLRIDTFHGPGGASSSSSRAQGILRAPGPRSSSDVAVSALSGSGPCFSSQGPLNRLPPNHLDWLQNTPFSVTDARTPRSSSPAASTARPIHTHSIHVPSSSSKIENQTRARPAPDMPQLHPVTSTPERSQLPQASHLDPSPYMSERRSVDPGEIVTISPPRTVTKPRSSSASLLATPFFGSQRLRNRSSNVSVISTPASVVDDQPSSSAAGGGKKPLWKAILPWKHRPYRGVLQSSQKTNPPSAASSELEQESESEGLRSPLGSSAGGTSPFRTPSSTAPSVVRGRISNLQLGMSPMLCGNEGGQVSVEDPEGDAPPPAGDEADYEYDEEDWGPDNWSDDDSFELDEDPNHAVSMFGAGGLLSVRSGEPTRRVLTFGGGEDEVWEPRESEERIGGIGGQRRSEDILEGYWTSGSPLTSIHPGSPWTSPPQHHFHQNTTSPSPRSHPSHSQSYAASGSSKVEPHAHLLDQYAAALERRQVCIFHICSLSLLTVIQSARRSQSRPRHLVRDGPIEAQEEGDSGSSDDEGGLRLPQRHR